MTIESQNNLLTVDIDSFVRMFLQVEFLFDVLPQQVADFFIIDFQIGGMDKELGTLHNTGRLENMSK